MITKYIHPILCLPSVDTLLVAITRLIRYQASVYSKMIKSFRILEYNNQYNQQPIAPAYRCDGEYVYNIMPSRKSLRSSSKKLIHQKANSPESSEDAMGWQIVQCSSQRAGPVAKLWNTLPESVKSNSIDSFKKNLKTFLFKTAFWYAGITDVIFTLLTIFIYYVFLQKRHEHLLLKEYYEIFSSPLHTWTDYCLK